MFSYEYCNVVKSQSLVSNVTYNVFSGTLNPTHLLTHLPSQ